ncbi:integrase [Thermococcus sp.]
MWAIYKKQFAEWLSDQITPVVKKDYLKALEVFFGRHSLKTYEDLEKALKAENYNDRIVKGLRKFTTFLEEKHIIDYHLADDWRRIMKIKRKTGVRAVFVTDEEIREAYKAIKKRGEEKRILFELLVYSGIRLTHAVQLVNTFNWKNVYIVNEKVARYPLFAFSRGKKRGFWAYAPKEFYELLEPMNVNYASAKDWVSYEKVSANTIRKWHYTFLVRHGVAPDVADYIQGRSSTSVGARHYGHRELLADEAYSRVVDDIKKVLASRKIKGGG